jgi:hypothetical protein
LDADGDLGDDVELVAANRAGVEAVSERLVGRALASRARLRLEIAHERRPHQRPGTCQHLSA